MTKPVMKTLALPAWRYGNPIDVIDRLRDERRKMLRLRKHKSRRIQILVKQAMKKGGRSCG